MTDLPVLEFGDCIISAAQSALVEHRFGVFGVPSISKIAYGKFDTFPSLISSDTCRCRTRTTTAFGSVRCN